jgi:hypothetical protein
VDLAALPARPLEVPRDGRLEASVVVAGDQHNAMQPPRRQPPEQLVVGRLALGVGPLAGEDLAPPIVADAGDDEHALADHVTIDAGVLVASIDTQVGIARRQRPFPPRRQRRVQRSRQGRDLALGEARSAQLLGDRRRFAGGDPLHIHL